MQTFRGYIDPLTTDLKKEKTNLSRKAQNYLLYNIGKHDENANVVVHKLDNSGYVVIDCDDKYTFDYVESVINDYDFKPNGPNRTPSISNVFRNDEGENKYKHHYWFSTDNKQMQKLLGVNGTKLDILGKDLVFEVIGHEHREKCYDIDFFHGLFSRILRIKNTDPNYQAPQIKQEKPAAVAVAAAAVEIAVEEPSVSLEAQKAWIDKNTKISDARTYKTWSETMFKIRNKYGNSNVGREMAHHFSKKNKEKYNQQNVDIFWHNIKTEKIDKCVFGLGVDERAAMLNELFLNYQTEMIDTHMKQKKEKKKEIAGPCNSELEKFEPAYAKIKEVFEKTHFLNLATSCFVQEVCDEDERKLILRNSSEMGVSFRHLRIHYYSIDEDGNKVERETYFINHWVNDEHIRKYAKMDTYPIMEECPEDVYNLWTPFRITKTPMPEETEEIKKGVAFLRNHLSIMCNHEVDTIAEFEKWVAHLIQFPQHKSWMPIFQSDEGAGKGSFCLLMRALLGKTKVFITSSPDEYVWGKFNNLMETAFLVFMDEINRFMTGTGLDKIKNVVTEDTIQIQHKGKGAYTMFSNHRFVSFTNAWDGGMPVNKKARRVLMCKMSNEKIGNMEYFNKFYELLKNDEILRAFYEYYATLKDIPVKLPPPIQTEFQKEMAELTVDVPTLWLRDFIGDAKRNKKTLLQNKETSTMYKIINKETKTEFINGKFETTEIANCGDYVIELFGKTTFEKIMKWAKENGYEKYETTPTKISIFLQNKKWSGLTKGKKLENGNTMYFYVDILAEMLEL
jgi:hypothetical protein